MGIVKGLAGINKQLDNGGGSGDRVKAKFFKLLDGKSVKVRFLQEFDMDSPHYNAEAGLGFLAIEHQAPGNFQRRALCTVEDEGRCYGCEQYAAGNKDFRQKSKLYVNVLVTQPDGTQEVQVLSQGNGPKSVTPALLDAAGEFGSGTNRQFKISRKGAGQTDTSYTLTPLDKDDEPYDVLQHEMFDLEKVVYEKPYEEQAAYYNGSQQAAVGAGAGASSDAEVW
jgi:hypothetical protein